MRSNLHHMELDAATRTSHKVVWWNFFSQSLPCGQSSNFRNWCGCIIPIKDHSVFPSSLAGSPSNTDIDYHALVAPVCFPIHVQFLSLLISFTRLYLLCAIFILFFSSDVLAAPGEFSVFFPNLPTYTRQSTSCSGDERAKFGFNIGLYSWTRTSHTQARAPQA